MRLPLVLKKLAGDRRGTSVVELALLLPFLTLLTVGIVDLSNGIATRMQLSQAVNRTLEMAAGHDLTADKDESEVDFDYLKEEAARAADVDIDNVTLETWLECNGVEQDDYESTCDAGEVIARYLQIRIDTVFDPTFNIGPLGGEEGVPLFAEAALRIQ